MRQIKRRFSTLILLLVISAYSLDAQSIKIINPSNANASANEIKRIFGDLINVSAADIENFYDHHWDLNNPYDAFCPTPDPSLEGMTETDVTFDWPLIPTGQVDHYTVRYLRLSDGGHDVFNINNNSITVSTPNDWFLFSFQSKCGTGLTGETGSATYIIIVERPVAFEESVSNCNNYNLIWHSPFSTNSIIPHTAWAPNSSFEKYKFVVYYNFLTIASFKAGIEFGSDGLTPEVVTVDPSSFSNVALSLDDTYIYAHLPGNIESELGIFSFAEDPYADELNEDPVFAYSPSENAYYPKGKIFLYKCKDHPSIGSDLPSSLNSTFPNDISLKEKSGSFNPQKVIEYNLPTDENISISLYDNQGKLLKTVVKQKIESAGLHQQEIDLSNYPDGLYFCILKTKTSSLPLKLIKN